MNIDGTLGNKYQGPTFVRPFDFGTDAIERQRVSLGQSLIDADFEYGLQPTKWQTYQELRRFPAFFEIPGADLTVSNVVTDQAANGSNITVYFSNATSLPPPLGSVISVSGLANSDRNADRAEGFFLVTSNLGTSATLYANTCNYIAKGTVTNAASSNLQTSYTVVRRGGVFTNSASKLTIAAISNNFSNIQVTTTEAHGLVPGTPITANSSGFQFNGNYFVSNVTSANTFNVVTTSNTTVATPGATNLYMNPYSYSVHRPFDGGVLISPAQPSYGASVCRQSKKVFRYQSGKGLLWSSGTLFCPNNDVAQLILSGKSANVSATSNVNGLLNGNLVINVSSAIFSPGEIIASTLASNTNGNTLGTVTITSTQTVNSNAQINVSYTGNWTFPGNGNISSNTTVTTLPVGSNIQVVCSIPHGAPQAGATVQLRGFVTPNVNGTYTVGTIVDNRTINILSTNVLTNSNPPLGDQPRFIMTNWHGASVRAGCFDDQNGVFWEWDGQNLFAVKRSSTFQLAGFVTVTTGSQVVIGSNVTSTPAGTFTNAQSITVNAGDVQATVVCSSHTLQPNMYTTNLGANLGSLGRAWVVGVPTSTVVTIGFLPAPSAASGAPTGTFTLPSTRFLDQVRVNDKITIRGMTHQVTSVQGQGVITVNPPFRGQVTISNDAPVIACKIKELRTPQSQFNRDPLDGTGPSGFKVDLTRMQMIGLQYTWYGAGFIDFMMRGADGNWVYAHRYRNNNVNDEAYMRTGNMPVRYELINECQSAVGTLASNISPTIGTLTINEPTTYFPTAGTLMVDNELIGYTGKTANTFTGCTRPTTLSYNINDAARIFSGQPASNHAANSTVSLISTTCTPSLTHWGSAFLMDGNFDQDRGYFFNYANTSVPVAATGTSVAFAIRLAPSVSNGVIGDIGARELLNRAQLLLQKLEITSPSGANLQVTGVLNPTNITFTSNNWIKVPSQPSFTQIYDGGSIASTTGATPGEQIFSTISQGGNQSVIDLSALKEMTNAIIGGNQPFPDGPDTLAINVKVLTAGSTGAVAQVNLFWSEAQA